MSATNIDELMDIWSSSMAIHDDSGPFPSHGDLYEAIDSTALGDAPWSCLKTEVPKPIEAGTPSWKTKEYKIWYRDPEVVIRNMLDNPDFDGGMDYVPYVEVDESGKRRWSNFLSGNFAWRHSVSGLHCQLQSYANAKAGQDL